MTREFVSYKIALDMKSIGFDEPCLAFYVLEKNGDYKLYDKCEVKTYFTYISAPLYQQAFRWFREKHGLLHDITLTLNINDELESFYILIHKLNGLVMNEDDDIELNVKTTNKEEAESACLDKLIEICKNN